MSDEPEPPSTERTTQELDPRDVHSWPVVLAGLERLLAESAFAYRLGVLGLIKERVALMMERDAGPEHVDRMRELVEALAHMEWNAVPAASRPPTNPPPLELPPTATR